MIWNCPFNSSFKSALKSVRFYLSLFSTNSSLKLKFLPSRIPTAILYLSSRTVGNGFVYMSATWSWLATWFNFTLRLCHSSSSVDLFSFRELCISLPRFRCGLMLILPSFLPFRIFCEVLLIFWFFTADQILCSTSASLEKAIASVSPITYGNHTARISNAAFGRVPLTLPPLSSGAYLWRCLLHLKSSSLMLHLLLCDACFQLPWCSSSHSTILASESCLMWSSPCRYTSTASTPRLLQFSFSTSQLFLLAPPLSRRNQALYFFFISVGDGVSSISSFCSIFSLHGSLIFATRHSC